MATYDWMFSKLPPQAMDTFILGGFSAGGLAVYNWIDYIADRIKSVNPNVKVIGAPESGFFLNYTNQATHDCDYTLTIKVLVDLVNEEIDLANTACLNAFPASEKHSCMMAEHLINHIETPLIML